MCSRAPRRGKNAQPREAPTGRAGALFHRIASSRLPVPTRGRRRRAIVRFDSIRFDSTTSIRYLHRRRRRLVARARARRRRSVVRVSRGRSRRHESNRICIESASNLNRIESARRADRRGTRRPIVVRSSSRLVSSRLVVGLASSGARRVVSVSRSVAVSHPDPFPPVSYPLDDDPAHPRVCVVVTSRDPCHCPCPAPVPRVCVRTRGFGRLHYEREDDAGATGVRPRARRPPRARPHPRRRHTTTTTTR